MHDYRVTGVTYVRFRYLGTYGATRRLSPSDDRLSQHDPGACIAA